MSERPRVLQVCPDPEIGGGMAEAMKGLLSSPLADHFRLELLPTYRGPQPLRRVGVLALALRRRVVLQVHSGAGDIAAFRGRLRGWRLALIGAALRRADAVLAVSEASATALREAGVRAGEIGV